MGYYCNNEDEHRQDAQRDFRYGGAYGYDREDYDRYSSDGCKIAYTEEFDRAVNEERTRQEEEEIGRQMEEEQMMQEQARMERIRDEDEYYSQQMEQKQQQIEPTKKEIDDDLPF